MMLHFAHIVTVGGGGSTGSARGRAHLRVIGDWWLVLVLEEDKGQMSNTVNKTKRVAVFLIYDENIA